MGIYLLLVPRCVGRSQLVVENGSVNVRRDWIDVQSSMVERWIGHLIISGLECRNVPEPLRPKESKYDLEALYCTDEPAVGRCLVTEPSGDKLFAKEHVVTFARKHFFDTEVSIFNSDIHNSRFFYYSECSADIIGKLFKSTV